MPNIRLGLVLKCWLVAFGAGLTGCAMGALPSSDGHELTTAAPVPDMADGEFHSTTCEGLALEHRERVDRISKLELAMQSELKTLPTTIAQALARVSPTPEAGTASYPETVAERTRLKSNEDAAAKLKCPIQTAAKAP